MVIAEFSAPWTEANRKAGKWQEIPDTVSGAVHLVPSELAAQTFVFTPGKGFESHAFSLDASGVEDFLCFVPTKEDESPELRFKITSASQKAARTLEAFGHAVGEAAGKLVISYEDTATLPLISEEQAADTARTN